jgi:exopolysaccharide biosynthesis protein
MKKTRANPLSVRIVHLLLCELVFLPLFAFLLVYHSPFTSLKEKVVVMSMGTTGNKFFATLFVPQPEIDEIMKRMQSVVGDDTQNPGDISIVPLSPTPTLQQGEPTPTLEPVATIVDIERDGFKGKLLTIRDPSRVFIGFAPHIGSYGAPLSSIVEEFGALGGVNAGGFVDGLGYVNGAVPNGIAIQDGKILFAQKGLSKYNVIGFNYDNILIVSNGMTLEEIKAADLRCAVSFGPALILNGKPLVEQAGEALEPRTGIGQRKDGTILLLVIDGRQIASHGASYLDVQNVLLEYGAYNAANLDGGTSATMNFLGKTANSPCDILGERTIASAVLFK